MKRRITDCAGGRVAICLTAVFCGAIGFGAELRGAAPIERSADLIQVQATVLEESDRELAARMIEVSVNRRLQMANDHSSAEWAKIDGRAEWERFAGEKLAAMRDSLSLVRTESAAPLNARVTGTVIGKGYRIENVVFQSRPGFWVTANLYRPEKAAPSMPGILISHAHHTPKEHGELQDMGVTWARAGCYVLVPDHLGHGERRQHPFGSANDYARPFQVGRQDYYFRYDLGIQLQLAGESLIGWMAWDLMRGVDLLLSQVNIDPERIILLGAVAGGGDPSAVTAALDERIAAAVPFNFGGPQPETRYPLPEDAERLFHYSGNGSWESTRNLRRSAADGFLPWVIVGGIAPRRLIYAHEFSWDRDRDPVWKRLQTIYGYFQAPDHLAFTHGAGELRGRPPEATHCTHIGPPHRRLIHAAFKQWFGIDVTSESSDRHTAQELLALTPKARRELHPRSLAQALSELAKEQVARAHERLSELSLEERRRKLREDWSGLLGNVEPPAEFKLRAAAATPSTDPFSTERVLLTVEPSIIVPVLLLKPSIGGEPATSKQPVVLAVAQDGKQRFVRERATEIGELIAQGAVVCLPDLRGTGETSPDTGRGRRSAATSLSSSELMLGGTMAGARLRDLRTVIAWLRKRTDLQGRPFVLWGDSFAEPNSSDTDFQVPRDHEHLFPRSPEPLGGFITLLCALFEDDVRAVYVRGGLISFSSVVTELPTLIPHDAVVPGGIAAGDLGELVAALAPKWIRLEQMVDHLNRNVSAAELKRVYSSAVSSYRADQVLDRFSYIGGKISPGQWLASHRMRDAAKAPQSP